MNWGAITVFFVVAAGVDMIGLEIVRSIVDRRQKERDGLGGTQDIAIWGVLIGYVFIVAAFISGMFWLWNR